MTAVRTAPLLPLRPEQPILLEASLVTRAQAGDAPAFRVIFERHAPAVRRFLRDLLSDDAAADEATQETFVRAHSRLRTLQKCDRLLPWLFGIARNVSLEALRQRKRAAGREPDDVPEQADEGPDPEGLLLGQEADALLATALSHLPEHRSAALLLRLDHGLGYEDIAAVMGWSVAKVKNEIHRARLQLRAELTKYVGGNP